MSEVWCQLETFSESESLTLKNLQCLKIHRLNYDELMVIQGKHLDRVISLIIITTGAVDEHD
jgi:hypothetical protein